MPNVSSQKLCFNHFIEKKKRLRERSQVDKSFRYDNRFGHVARNNPNANNLSVGRSIQNMLYFNQIKYFFY